MFVLYLLLIFAILMLISIMAGAWICVSVKSQHIFILFLSQFISLMMSWWVHAMRSRILKCSYLAIVVSSLTMIEGIVWFAVRWKHLLMSAHSCVRVSRVGVDSPV